MPYRFGDGTGTLGSRRRAQTSGQYCAKKPSQTPIGDSLKAAAGDLADVEGEKIVLLITDGEETCDGDAEAAIETLAGAGVNAVVNIIGFAVDDEALAATFARWANTGGGQYRSADDQKALQASLTGLTAQPFQVFDESNQWVAEGTSGDLPMELKVGDYRVRFGPDREVDVSVVSKRTRVVTLSP